MARTVVQRPLARNAERVPRTVLLFAEDVVALDQQALRQPAPQFDLQRIVARAAAIAADGCAANLVRVGDENVRWVPSFYQVVPERAVPDQAVRRVGAGESPRVRIVERQESEEGRIGPVRASITRRVD